MLLANGLGRIAEVLRHRDLLVPPHLHSGHPMAARRVTSDAWRQLRGDRRSAAPATPDSF